MAQIYVNGVLYASGDSISINNDGIVVDGKPAQGTLTSEGVNQITIHGDVDNLIVDRGMVTVSGDVERLRTTSGSVVVKGGAVEINNVSGGVNVDGDVDRLRTTSGSVVVKGDVDRVDASSGSIKADHIEHATTMSGNITRG